MDIQKLLTTQWDRLLAVVCTIAGAVILIVGYAGISGTSDVASQMPYIISGGIGGVFLLGVGAALWISADLRDEWHKLDRIEDALRGGTVGWSGGPAASASAAAPASTPASYGGYTPFTPAPAVEETPVEETPAIGEAPAREHFPEAVDTDPEPVAPPARRSRSRRAAVRVDDQQPDEPAGETLTEAAAVSSNGGRTPWTPRDPDGSRRTVSSTRS